MKYNREQLIERIRQGEDLQYVFFWIHTDDPEKVTAACLSQWYPCRFTAEGAEYCCAEQYMMAQKALLFGDRAIWERIMAAELPKEIKALGREISGFDQKAWDEHKERIVLNGNIAKFSQNEPLKAYLLGTGNAVLAEASPYDAIWGIKRTASDPLAKDPESWKGRNLLGFILMETRDLLKAEK